MYRDELEEAWSSTRSLLVVREKVAQFLSDGSVEGPHAWRDVLESETLPPSCLDGLDIDFNLRDPDGNDAYHAALERRHVVATAWLFANGVLVSDQPAYDGRTSLHVAAERNRCAAIGLVLQRGGLRHLNAIDDLGRSPLAEAVEKGFAESAIVLLSGGADPNASSEDKPGYSALQYAVANDDPDMVGLLLSFGADPNQPGWMRLSAVLDAQASTKPNAAVIRQLLQERI